MKERYEGMIFFLRRMELIAWLHESMSRRNPSRRSASSHESVGESLLFFHFMFDSQEKSL